MTNQAITQVNNSVRQLYNRVRYVFGLGRTTTEVNDSGSVRYVQAQLGANQIKDNLPLIQHYGFASNPPPGTDLAVHSANGDRSAQAATGSNNQQYAIKNLGNGGVALYDMFGNSVQLTSTGVVVTSAAALTVNSASALNINAPNATVTAANTVSFVGEYINAAASIGMSGWPGGGVGPPGPPGPTGPAGPTGATGAGLNTGGTEGQWVQKNSSTNYDTIWVGGPVVVTGSSSVPKDQKSTFCNCTSPSTQTLPAAPYNGERHMIKDMAGNAGTYNITVSGNGNYIDGALTQIISFNYGAITVEWNGSNWSIVA